MTQKKAESAGPPLALPHERDENTPAPGTKRGTRSVIKRAARDIEAGMVDTDNYTRATAVAARRKRRGVPP